MTIRALRWARDVVSAVAVWLAHRVYVLESRGLRRG